MIFTLTTSRFVHIFHGVTKSIIANWIVSQFMEQKKRSVIDRLVFFIKRTNKYWCSTPHSVIIQFHSIVMQNSVCLF